VTWDTNIKSQTRLSFLHNTKVHNFFRNMAEQGQNAPAMVSISLEEGWNKIKTKALAVLENFLENGSGGQNKIFPPHEYMPIYT
jgi:3-oxoacyl-[acyl-carrier-protein] synthase III